MELGDVNAKGHSVPSRQAPAAERGHVAGVRGRDAEHGGEARVPDKGAKRGGVEPLVRLPQPDAVGGEHMRRGRRLPGSAEGAPLRARREPSRPGPGTTVIEAGRRGSVGAYADPFIAGQAWRAGTADLDRWWRSASMSRRRLPMTRNMGRTGGGAVMNLRYLPIRQRRAFRRPVSVSGIYRPADGWRMCRGFMADSPMVLARRKDTT